MCDGSIQTVINKDKTIFEFTNFNSLQRWMNSDFIGTALESNPDSCHTEKHIIIIIIIAVIKVDVIIKRQVICSSVAAKQHGHYPSSEIIFFEHTVYLYTTDTKQRKNKSFEILL